MTIAPVGRAVQFAEVDGADWWAAIVIGTGVAMRRHLKVCDASGAWTTQASVPHEDSANAHEPRWREVPE